MTFLPIVERELRVRARLPGTYRLRLAGAGIAIIIATFLLVLGSTALSSGRVGATMFGVLAWLTFLYCLLEGTRNTADCLSEEKREGTLGLLFLTDLKAYDVVLGKLIASGLNSFYGLLAVFPPLALPLLLGGVTPGEFWRLVLVLVHTLFFSLTAGLLVSAASRRERTVWSSTLLLIGFFALAVPLLRWVPYSPFPMLAMASPTVAFLALDDAAYRADAGTFWWTLAGIQILSWGFLLGANWILPLAWQDRVEPPAELRRRTAPPSRPVAVAPAQPLARRHLLNLNPALWLASRADRQQVYLWIVVAVTAGPALAAWWLTGGWTVVAVPLLAGALALHFLLTLWAAWQASYLFAEARQSGALELLLGTPLSVKEILDGHFLALRRMFFAPVAALLAVEALMLVGYIATLDAGTEALLVLLGVGLCLVMFVLDLYAVAWFGMWMGLRTKRPSLALTKTVLVVLILPMSTALCCQVLWPVVSMVKSLAFMSYAQDQLRRQFRALAIERFGGAEGEPRVPPPPPKAGGRLPSVLD